MMRLLLKKTAERIRGINREYFLLFGIVIVIGCLIYSSMALTQLAAPQEITLTTFYPLPFGEFQEVRARRVLDFDNVARWVDPNGESRFQNLRLFEGLRTREVRGGGAFLIDFNFGRAWLATVTTTGRITMGAVSAGPDVAGPIGGSRRTGGKFVYDIAEGMEAAGCEAGDVVIIGEDEGCDLVKSTVSFDSRVAGIISTDPKLYMGDGEGKLPLALAGIVACKASAENGAIKRGDLLVTSSLPGHAMRAESRDIKPGMVIGKALQALEQGKGMIFVLVNKQ
ncbi:MAG: hypothetical protein KKH34_09840 [Candidatus Omnitrophica bacterium]|nr:hypothetical protein [Candidatus Omnitrophota bacterium]